MAGTEQDKPKATAGGKCPICGAPTETAFRPFCSSRCANVDLMRWLRGAYVISGGKEDEDEDGDVPAARLGREREDDDGSSEH
jgi:endogenous inhibitor of DNA gyrase (YacG/DUF329 family)